MRGDGDTGGGVCIGISPDGPYAHAEAARNKLYIALIEKSLKYR
jgi:hypothetical protein